MPLKSNLIRLLAIVLLIITLVYQTNARYYENSIGIMAFRRNGGWNFVDRIVVDQGRMDLKYKISIKSKDIKIGTSYMLELVAVPAQLWQRETQVKCELQKYSEQERSLKKIKQISKDINLNEENNYQFEYITSIEITNKTSYNFILRDCQKTILKQNFGKYANLQFNIDIRNNGYYSSSTQSIYSWMLPIIFCVGLAAIYRLKREQDNDASWVKLTIIWSLWSSLVSILFKYVGYVIYAYISGLDYQFFDFMYLLFHSLSDSIVMVLLFLLAFGWTVTFRHTKDFDLYLPLSSMLGLVNIILTVLNKVTDGQSQKYHIYDSITAFIMIFFRLIGFGIFSGGCIWSYIKLKPDESNIKRYLIYLLIIGTIFLTFIPFSMYLVQFVEFYYRKEVIFFSIEVVRYVIFIWFGYLTTSKKSIYVKIVQGSFMEKDGKYY